MPPINMPNKNAPMVITTLSICIFTGVLGGIPLTSEFWETKFSACYNIRHLSYVEILTAGIRLPAEKI